jgi:hypothetical protein
MTRSNGLVLAVAAFSLFAFGAFAQPTAPAPDAGGAVATAPANPEANPKVVGDKSTISGDKKATADQKTEAE